MLHRCRWTPLHGRIRKTSSIGFVCHVANRLSGLYSNKGRYRLNSKNRTMFWVVQNFLLWERVDKHTKKKTCSPRQIRKEETPDLGENCYSLHYQYSQVSSFADFPLLLSLIVSTRGNSNVLAHDPIIRVFTVSSS